MRLLSLILTVVLAAVPAAAQWQPDARSSMELSAAAAVNDFRTRQPRTQRYFDEARAWAVFPLVTRIGFGFGGAYGRGIVVEGDSTVGSTSFWQFTSGIQAGASNFSMIVFFRDQAALELYQLQQAQFLGQAGLALGPLGIAGTPAYNDGVAIVTMTRFGLMAEFTVSGAKFTYRPHSGL